MTLYTLTLWIKVLFLFIVGQNKCACKVGKKSTFLPSSTVGRAHEQKHMGVRLIGVAKKNADARGQYYYVIISLGIYTKVLKSGGFDFRLMVHAYIK